MVLETLHLGHDSPQAVAYKILESAGAADAHQGAGIGYAGKEEILYAFPDNVKLIGESSLDVLRGNGAREIHVLTLVDGEVSLSPIIHAFTIDERQALERIVDAG